MFPNTLSSVKNAPSSSFIEISPYLTSGSSFSKLVTIVGFSLTSVFVIQSDACGLISSGIQLSLNSRTVDVLQHSFSSDKNGLSFSFTEHSPSLTLSLSVSELLNTKFAPSSSTARSVFVLATSGAVFLSFSQTVITVSDANFLWSSVITAQSACGSSVSEMRPASQVSVLVSEDLLPSAKLGSTGS